MKFTEFFRKLKNKVFPVKSGNGFQGIGSKIETEFTREEASAYVEHVRGQFKQLIETRNIFIHERNIDAVSRIHPALAANLAASLQRNSYADFFRRAKSLIIDIGNFPQVSGGPAFGTDFVSFGMWARSKSCTLKSCSQHLDEYQQFVNLVCLSSDVLSKPAESLSIEGLSPDMVLLAQVTLRDTGWNEPESLAHMETSAWFVVKQVRTLIDIVIPGAFSPEQPSGA